MHPVQPVLRPRLGRAIETLMYGTVLIACFVAGAWVARWDSHSQKDPSAARESAPAGYDLSTGNPRVDALPPVDPREPEPRAVAARAAVILREAAAIREECQRAAGGDRAKWQCETQRYRTALKARIDALRRFPNARSREVEAQYEPLEGRQDFPLFEVGSREHLSYLYDPKSLDEFRRNRQVVAARRWLGDRGIDLIFVPVPKMTEIYIEHFLDPCPPDGIIAPHVRETLMQLLNEDVEVVDGFTLFRPMRDADSEYLFNAADTHWAPRAMRIMAKEIADRVMRYRFGARARFALPIVRTAPGPYVFDGLIGGMGGPRGWTALSPEQEERARRAQTTNLSDVWMQDGRPPHDDPASPVLVIGHSYAPRFLEQLVKEMNLLVHSRIHNGETTTFFADFLREPELLAHCRVVVWITTERDMTQFQIMPGPVMRALEVGK
jgi:hypothetical protein